MGEPGDLRQTYAFSCTGCGHAWKQSYEIAIVTDPAGGRSQAYMIDGRRVRSPLTSPLCPHCESRQVHAVPVGLAERALAAEAEPLSRPKRHQHTPHMPHGPRLHLRHSGRTDTKGGADTTDDPPAPAS